VHRILATEGKYVAREFLAEPYLPGTSMTVGVLDVGGETIALPVLEAVPTKEFYDNEAKNDPALTEYRCPAPVPDETADWMRATALSVFELCGCHGFGRVDFMLADTGPTVLELNTVPGLARTGNLATMALAAGIEYEAMIDIILTSALRRPAGYLP
jgi:D-alanine-D-alanine ligase